MKKNLDIVLRNVSLPSTTAPDSEKKTKEFGLRIGHSIAYEWFKGEGSNNKFYGRWNEFHRRRLYARGEQSIKKYKNELAINGDLSYLNLDWTPIPVIPKFVDIVVNGMSDRLFKPKAYAQDALSQSNRNKYQDIIEGQMAAKDVLDIIQERSGANPYIMNPDDLPQNDEELQLYMQLKYKPAIEIAEETAISTIFDENKYEDLRKRLDYDNTVLGISVAKHEFLPGSGVGVSYVDPAQFVYSYTEDPYFKDCIYFGEVKTHAISDLVKYKPDITPEELELISKASGAWYDRYNLEQYYDDDIFSQDSCTLLFFNYRTTKKFVFKKKILENGGSKVIEKDDSFDPPKEMMDERGFEKIEKTIEVWYEGIMVLGTDILLKWEMSKNMVRPKSASQHAIPNYVVCAPRMYKGQIESLVTRMIPFADSIQLSHLKLQQVAARVVPDGIYLDADGLNSIDLGNGLAYNPSEAIRMFYQTGSVIGRSYTEDGEFNHGKVPIQEITHSSGINKIQALIGQIDHYFNMIRAVTGLNEARDASTPDPNSLVGLQKLAALNSNTATRHILDAGLFVYRTLAEALSYRIADILEYSDFKDDFVNKIGKYNVGILDSISDLYLYDFGIFIEVSPDEEQKAQLEANIQMALSKGDISLEDAIDVREIKNIKLANQLLKLKRKAKLDREERIEMQKKQMDAQVNMQSQQMAAQIAAQKQQMETQSKIAEEEAKANYEIIKLREEARLKKELMAEEFMYQMRIKGIEVDGMMSKEKMKEEEKAKRIDQQSTQQSKMIDQRKNDLPPINFESNEDSLDGFDMAEFEPR